MSLYPATVADERPEKQISFLESLSLDSRESLAFGDHEKLVLFPNPSTIDRASQQESNQNLRGVSSKAPPNALVTVKESPVPAISQAPIHRNYSNITGSAALLRTATTSPRSQTQRKVSKSNMAPASKAQIQCLAVCHKSTVFGNRVAVHILEYLTTASPPARDFELLAHEFLDTIAILASIEAGLKDNSQRLPAEMISELDIKFRVAITDFQALDHVVNKLLEIELNTKSRIKRGWGKMFGDNDLTRHKSALARTRESLKLSALVFQWSVGSEKIEKEMGIGFTSLAAALSRLDEFEKKVVANNPVVKSVEQSYTAEDTLSPLPVPVDKDFQPGYQRPNPQQQLPPHHYQQHGGSWQPRSSSNQLMPGDFHIQPPDFRQYSIPPTPTTMHTPSSVGTNEHAHPWSSERGDPFERSMHIVSIDDAHSHTGTVESDSLLNELAGMEIDPNKVIRLVAEPSTMQHWQPRTPSGPDAGNMRAALISAIRSRNHQLMEQMLDRGVPANTGPDMPALKEAILAHDAESVRLLLLFGADPNDPDRNGLTPLFVAVEQSFLAGATFLLKYGADPNLAAGPDLESPLALATISNMVGLTHLLLIYNGDVNQMTSNGNTILISAIKKRTPKKFIDLLLKYGALPNAKSREGKTALFEAIQLGRADLVQSLLNNGADANLPGPKHMLWPSTFQAPCLKLLLDAGADAKKCPGIMELATSLNNIESVRILLKAGVNPNAKKDGVYTPLCTAIRDDRTDLFELLLSNKADPNTPASEYPAFKCLTHHRVHFLPALVAAGADLHSPKGIVETAVKSNSIEGLNWLLDHGLSPNEKNPKGHSPLSTAIAEDHIEMVDLLLHRGADPNMRGQDWPVCLAVKNPPILSRILAQLPEPRAFKGVMEMAVSANQLESVKLLIAAGVSVEDKNGGVFSPLTTALRENHRHIVKYLLTEAGADVNSPGEHLPVVKALRRFHGEDTEMLELLLDHGADPNLVYRGWNGMMQAVENGDEDVLRLIVKRHIVDLQVKDELGRNVVKIAESRGWSEAVNIIMDGRS